MTAPMIVTDWINLQYYASTIDNRFYDSGNKMLHTVVGDHWSLYNTYLAPCETVRVFPLSNWTELDIWLYIQMEAIDIVPLYFSAPRVSWVCEESAQIFALDDDRMVKHLSPAELESVRKRHIRFRTLGCYPQTGAVESHANSVKDIIQELLLSKRSEREGRMLDKDQSGSMERKKRAGYF